MSIDDGGPAFPFPTTGANGETATGGPWAASPGMSLRAWLAGRIQPALIQLRGLQTHPTDIATEACLYADALLAKLKKKP